MKLLYVNCCISQRGEDSRTGALCNAFVDAWQAEHPEACVETLDLRTLPLEPLTPEALNRRDALAQAGMLEDPMFALARQFGQADRIVIGAPFWDLSFPAQLRIYIEHICANGVNYFYDADGVHGNCQAGALCYLTSGGDVERPGSLGVAYWRQLSSLFGIPVFRHVFAGGLDCNPADSAALLGAACVRARTLAREF